MLEIASKLLRVLMFKSGFAALKNQLNSEIRILLFFLKEFDEFDEKYCINKIFSIIVSEMNSKSGIQLFQIQNLWIFEVMFNKNQDFDSQIYPSS